MFHGVIHKITLAQFFWDTVYTCRVIYAVYTVGWCIGEKVLGRERERWVKNCEILVRTLIGDGLLITSLLFHTILYVKHITARTLGTPNEVWVELSIVQTHRQLTQPQSLHSRNHCDDITKHWDKIITRTFPYSKSIRETQYTTLTCMYYYYIYQLLN